jgi:hypothetical protein
MPSIFSIRSPLVSVSRTLLFTANHRIGKDFTKPAEVRGLSVLMCSAIRRQLRPADDMFLDRLSCFVNQPECHRWIFSGEIERELAKRLDFSGIAE